MTQVPRSEGSEPGDTKHRRLADHLRSLIRDGSVAPGDRLPSYSQLRTRFQARQATVDRALSALEQDGLIVRRPRSGVFVAEHRSPRHPRIGVAGLGSVLIERPAPYWLELMAGAREAAAEAEAHLELLSDDDQVARWSHLDGLLISDADPRHAVGWRSRTRPCVSLLVPVAELPSVVADDGAAAGDLTRHLLYLGHRRIAYLTMLQNGQDERSNPICARRVAGFRAACAEAGITVEPSWVRSMADADHEDGFIGRGQRDMEQWLASGFRTSGCTALLAQNDETAVGAIAALAAAGIAVPGRVSVVGFDGTPASMLCVPRLTTAVVPLREIGRLGMQRVLTAIARPAGDEAMIICPVSIRVRASTAPAPLPA
jgi:DNA-binding LacI/PurR family transcriptional regulator